MSVIGRLDGQVDEVIISPLARRNKREPEEREGEPQPPAEAQTTEPTLDEKGGAKPGELPVWML